jgi:hypothetical protein
LANLIPPSHPPWSPGVSPNPFGRAFVTLDRYGGRPVHRVLLTDADLARGVQAVLDAEAARAARRTSRQQAVAATRSPGKLVRLLTRLAARDGR